MNDKEKAFMIGLEKLTRETGIEISGCGCWNCRAPFLSNLDDKELVPEAGYGFGVTGEILWIAPSDRYSWREFSTSIVKEEEK